MKPFKQLSGVVAPLDRANVDTDAIIPKQFLKRIERSGFGQFLFYEFRFDENGNAKNDFVLNQEIYKNAPILLSRSNFGCGSSREHAPWALEDFGFRVIIATSFADIFKNNCFNNGILPIELTSSKIDTLFEFTNKNPAFTLEVDLESKKITSDVGISWPFEVDDFKRHKLLNGLDEISLTLKVEHKISDYEKHKLTDLI